MNNVGMIWHYDDSQTIESNKTVFSHQINDIRHEDYPLLGQRMELMFVAAQILLLDEPINTSNRRSDLAAIIFEG